MIMKKLCALALAACLLLSAASAAVYETEDGRRVILSVGGSFVYAQDADGQVWVWGDNQHGQHGNGTTRSDFKFHEFVSPDGAIDPAHIRDIVAGSNYIFFLMDDGSVYGAGNNDYLSLAQPNKRYTTPVKLNLPAAPIALDAGFGHTMMLSADGKVWAWGRNGEYQVGNGSRKNVQEPYQLPLENIVQIACGGKFSLALDEQGQLWGWGDNENFNLVPNTSATQKTPVKLDTGDIDIAYIDATGGGIVLVDTEGAVWTWGRNDYRQLGYDTKGKSTKTPQKVELPLPVKQIAAYSSQTYAILEDGSLWAWGYNYNGQLGNGKANYDGMTPVKVWDSDVVMVQGGSLFVVAMLRDGTVLTAGFSKYGQTGEGSSKDKHQIAPIALDLIPDESGKE